MKATSRAEFIENPVAPSPRAASKNKKNLNSTLGGGAVVDSNALKANTTATPSTASPVPPPPAASPCASTSRMGNRAGWLRNMRIFGGGKNGSASGTSNNTNVTSGKQKAETEQKRGTAFSSSSSQIRNSLRAFHKNNVRLLVNDPQMCALFALFMMVVMLLIPLITFHGISRFSWYAEKEAAQVDANVGIGRYHYAIQDEMNFRVQILNDLVEFVEYYNRSQAAASSSSSAKDESFFEMYGERAALGLSSEDFLTNPYLGLHHPIPSDFFAINTTLVNKYEAETDAAYAFLREAMEKTGYSEPVITSLEVAHHENLHLFARRVPQFLAANTSASKNATSTRPTLEQIKYANIGVKAAILQAQILYRYRTIFASVLRNVPWRATSADLMQEMPLLTRVGIDDTIGEDIRDRTDQINPDENRHTPFYKIARSDALRSNAQIGIGFSTAQFNRYSDRFFTLWCSDYTASPFKPRAQSGQNTSTTTTNAPASSSSSLLPIRNYYLGSIGTASPFGDAASVHQGSATGFSGAVNTVMTFLYERNMNFAAAMLQSEAEQLNPKLYRFDRAFPPNDGDTTPPPDADDPVVFVSVFQGASSAANSAYMTLLGYDSVPSYSSSYAPGEIPDGASDASLPEGSLNNVGFNRDYLNFLASSSSSNRSGHRMGVVPAFQLWTNTTLMRPSIKGLPTIFNATTNRTTQGVKFAEFNTKSDGKLQAILHDSASRRVMLQRAYWNHYEAAETYTKDFQRRTLATFLLAIVSPIFAFIVLIGLCVLAKSNRDSATRESLVASYAAMEQSTKLIPLKYAEVIRNCNALRSVNSISAVDAGASTTALATTTSDRLVVSSGVESSDDDDDAYGVQNRRTRGYRRQSFPARMLQKAVPSFIYNMFRSERRRGVHQLVGGAASDSGTETWDSATTSSEEEGEELVARGDLSRRSSQSFFSSAGASSASMMSQPSASSSDSLLHRHIITFVKYVRPHLAQSAFGELESLSSTVIHHGTFLFEGAGGGGIFGAAAASAPVVASPFDVMNNTASSSRRQSFSMGFPLNMSDPGSSSPSGVNRGTSQFVGTSAPTAAAASTTGGAPPAVLAISSRSAASSQYLSTQLTAMMTSYDQHHQNQHFGRWGGGGGGGGLAGGGNTIARGQDFTYLIDGSQTRGGQRQQQGSPTSLPSGGVGWESPSGGISNGGGGGGGGGVSDYSPNTSSTAASSPLQQQQQRTSPPSPRGPAATAVVRVACVGDTSALLSRREAMVLEGNEAEGNEGTKREERHLRRHALLLEGRFSSSAPALSFVTGESGSGGAAIEGAEHAETRALLLGGEVSHALSSSHRCMLNPTTTRTSRKTLPFSSSSSSPSSFPSLLPLPIMYSRAGAGAKFALSVAHVGDGGSRSFFKGGAFASPFSSSVFQFRLFSSESGNALSSRRNGILQQGMKISKKNSKKMTALSLKMQQQFLAASGAGAGGGGDSIVVSPSLATALCAFALYGVHSNHDNDGVGGSGGSGGDSSSASHFNARRDGARRATNRLRLNRNEFSAIPSPSSSSAFYRKRSSSSKKAAAADDIERLCTSSTGLRLLSNIKTDHLIQSQKELRWRDVRNNTSMGICFGTILVVDMSRLNHLIGVLTERMCSCRHLFAVSSSDCHAAAAFSFGSKRSNNSAYQHTTSTGAGGGGRSGHPLSDFFYAMELLEQATEEGSTSASDAEQNKRKRTAARQKYMSSSAAEKGAVIPPFVFEDWKQSIMANYDSFDSAMFFAAEKNLAFFSSGGGGVFSSANVHNNDGLVAGDGAVLMATSANSSDPRPYFASSAQAASRSHPTSSPGFGGATANSHSSNGSPSRRGAEVASGGASTHHHTTASATTVAGGGGVVLFRAGSVADPHQYPPLDVTAVERFPRFATAIVNTVVADIEKVVNGHQNGIIASCGGDLVVAEWNVTSSSSFAQLSAAEAAVSCALEIARLCEHHVGLISRGIDALNATAAATGGVGGGEDGENGDAENSSETDDSDGGDDDDDVDDASEEDEEDAFGQDGVGGGANMATSPTRRLDKQRKRRNKNNKGKRGGGPSDSHPALALLERLAFKNPPSLSSFDPISSLLLPAVGIGVAQSRVTAGNVDSCPRRRMPIVTGPAVLRATSLAQQCLSRSVSAAHTAVLSMHSLAASVSSSAAASTANGPLPSSPQQQSTGGPSAPGAVSWSLLFSLASAASLKQSSSIMIDSSCANIMVTHTLSSSASPSSATASAATTATRGATSASATPPSFFPSPARNGSKTASFIGVNSNLAYLPSPASLAVLGNGNSSTLPRHCDIIPMALLQPRTIVVGSDYNLVAATAAIAAAPAPLLNATPTTTGSPVSGATIVIGGNQQTQMQQQPQHHHFSPLASPPLSAPFTVSHGINNNSSQQHTAAVIRNAVLAVNTYRCQLEQYYADLQQLQQIQQQQQMLIQQQQQFAQQQQQRQQNETNAHPSHQRSIVQLNAPAAGGENVAGAPIASLLPIVALASGERGGGGDVVGGGNPPPAQQQQQQHQQHRSSTAASPPPFLLSPPSPPVLNVDAIYNAVTAGGGGGADDSVIGYAVSIGSRLHGSSNNIGGSGGSNGFGGGAAGGVFSPQGATAAAAASTISDGAALLGSPAPPLATSVVTMIRYAEQQFNASGGGGNSFFSGNNFFNAKTTAESTTATLSLLRPTFLLSVLFPNIQLSCNNGGGGGGHVPVAAGGGGGGFTPSPLTVPAPHHHPSSPSAPSANDSSPVASSPLHSWAELFKYIVVCYCVFNDPSSALTLLTAFKQQRLFFAGQQLQQHQHRNSNHNNKRGNSNANNAQMGGVGGSRPTNNGIAGGGNNAATRLSPPHQTAALAANSPQTQHAILAAMMGDPFHALTLLEWERVLLVADAQRRAAMEL